MGYKIPPVALPAFSVVCNCASKVILGYEPVAQSAFSLILQRLISRATPYGLPAFPIVCNANLCLQFLLSPVAMASR